MSENSKNDLLALMLGRSITLGWDAISAYQRDSLNDIIWQQFSQYISTGELFDTAEEDIPENHDQNGDSTYIHANNLVLGQPRLSFDTATLDNATATLQIPFLSGFFFTLSESPDAPVALTGYHTVFPGSQLSLALDLPLQQSSSDVSPQSDIYFDLSGGIPGSATVNLTADDRANQQIGQYFLDKFTSIGVSARHYVLATLSTGDDEAPLTPMAFAIRTQAAPGGEGDGAVLVFVQTRNGTGGTLPSADSGFPYLIPDDSQDGNALYSGSVLISSRALCNDLVAPAFQSQISANGLSLQPGQSSTGSGLCGYLVATGGVAPTDSVTLSWSATHEADEYDYTATLASLDFPYAPQDGPGFTLVPNMTGLYQEWNNNESCVLQLHGSSPRGNSDGEENLDLVFYSHSHFPVSISPENAVAFHLSLNERDIAVNLPGISELLKTWDWRCEQTNELQTTLRGLVSQILHSADTTDLPDIALFTLDNQLFPDGSTLQLGDVAIPGDMALFGQLAPSSSSQSLLPRQTTVAAGTSCTFTLEADGASAVTWSIGNESGIDVTGRIRASANGSAVYQAPDRAALSCASMPETVTASFTARDGSIGKACAVVVVSGNAINLNPGFILATAGQAPITFTASVAGDADTAITWSKATETGSPQPGTHQASYSPVLDSGQSCALQTVTASIGSATGDTATASVLVMAPGTAPSLLVGGGSWQSGNPSEVVTGGLFPLPPYGQRQLTALEGNPDDGSYANVTASCTWQILDDPPQGSINQGLYVAPATITTSCVTILASNGNHFGYTVVPLAPGD